MAHVQKSDFVFRRNGPSLFKSAGGRQFSQLLAAEVRASAVVILDTPCSEVEWRVLVTLSIRRFPLHFPSRASPCAITFQLEFNSNRQINSPNVTAECLQLLLRIREIAGSILGPRTPYLPEPPTFTVCPSSVGEFIYSALHKATTDVTSCILQHSRLLVSRNMKLLLLLLLPLALQAHCGLWPVKQCPSIFSYLPPTLSICSLPALEDIFLLPLSIFFWVFPFFSSLPVLEWRSFWASYPLHSL